MANYPILETPRLILKPLEIDDIDQMQRVFPQWEIVQYLGSHIPWPYPQDGARFYIEKIALPAIQSGHSWNWTIRRKETPDELIGEIVIRHSDTENRGFWLSPQYRRRGYMTEASKAVTQYWFETLKQPSLTITKAVENDGSRGISRKEGMRMIGASMADLVCGRVEVERWEISREEWLSANTSSDC